MSDAATSRGHHAGTVAPWLFFRTGILVQHEQYIAEVEADRPHLHLKLPFGAGRGSKGGLLTQLYPGNSATIRKVHGNGPQPRVAGFPIAKRIERGSGDDANPAHCHTSNCPAQSEGARDARS